MTQNDNRTMVDEALVELGFAPVAKFGLYVTYRRAIDSVKIHVGPDGMFAAFGAEDEIIGEGKDADELRFIVSLPALSTQAAE
jgi:hypothetical protein